MSPLVSLAAGASVVGAFRWRFSAGATKAGDKGRLRELQVVSSAIQTFSPVGCTGHGYHLVPELKRRFAGPPRFYI
jgi:hypothetical protein